jgi:hypothetical protein
LEGQGSEKAKYGEMGNGAFCEMGRREEDKMCAAKSMDWALLRDALPFFLRRNKAINPFLQSFLSSVAQN